MDAYPQPETLVLDRAGPWLTVWLDRPQARNALSAQMADELAATARALHADREIRGVTFRGRGGVFCAGGDIRDFRSILAGGASHVDVAAFSHRAGELFHLVRELPQATVMLVEGAAVAGGLGLACAGDFVVATADAQFALTETMLGIPPAQIAPLVVERIGPSAARRIMLAGARLDAAEALRIGLLDELAADAAELTAREAKIRAGVLRCAPGANAETKRLVAAATRLDRQDMINMAADSFARCLLGPEGREGVAAFLEKRRPSWAVDGGDKP